MPDIFDQIHAQRSQGTPQQPAVQQMPDIFDQIHAQRSQGTPQQPAVQPGMLRVHPLSELNLFGLPGPGGGGPALGAGGAPGGDVFDQLHAADQTDAFRHQLETQGFLSSAWQALKGVPEMLGSVFTGAAGDQARADKARLDAIEAKGSYSQTSPEDKQFVQDYLIQHVPFASTAYKVAKGNVAGAAGDVAGMAPYMLLGAKGARGGAAEGEPPEGAAPVPTADAARGGLVKSTLNPVQQAAVDYLRSQDVPLNAGTVTGNKFLQGTQAIVQNQPLGAGVAADAARATEQGLTRVAGQLADQAHPSPATPESAGQAAPDSLNRQIGNLKLHEDEAYGDTWATVNDPANAIEVPVKTIQRPIYDATGKDTGQTEAAPVMAKVQAPVDVRGTKQQLAPFVQSMDSWGTSVVRDASPGYQAAKSIINGPDFISAQDAEYGLSGLKTMARVDNTDLRNTSQGMAAGIIQPLQDGIDAAVAKADPQALRSLQDGRAAHATKMQLADLTDQLKEEPVKNFQKLTMQNDTGIAFIRQIDAEAPGVMQQVGRGFITKLFDRATQEGGFSRAQGILREWQNLGPQTKEFMYPNPGLRSSLDNFFLGVKMLAENPNPSGTAVVQQATRATDAGLAAGGLLVTGHPLLAAAAGGVTGAWLLGGRAVAKLLFSPAGVRLLTGGLRAEAPGAAALRASQILRIAGPDDVTPIRPGGGPPPTPPAGSGGGGSAGGGKP